MRVHKEKGVGLHQQFDITRVLWLCCGSPWLQIDRWIRARMRVRRGVVWDWVGSGSTP